VAQALDFGFDLIGADVVMAHAAAAVRQQYGAAYGYAP
jgi:hypothetical protein